MAAAEVSLEHRLAMADAVVHATAQMLEATLVTSDEDFDELPGVTYMPQGGGLRSSQEGKLAVAREQRIGYNHAAHIV